MGAWTESVILGKKAERRRRRICCDPGVDEGDLILGMVSPGDTGIHIMSVSLGRCV